MISDSTGAGNGEWPYFGLKPRIFSYSSPEFKIDDLMPKYAFKQAQFELEFNKIENEVNEWVSIQTILDQVWKSLLVYGLTFTEFRTLERSD